MTITATMSQRMRVPISCPVMSFLPSADPTGRRLNGGALSLPGFRLWGACRRVVLVGGGLAGESCECTCLIADRGFPRQALHRGGAVEAVAMPRVLHDEVG